MPVTFTIQPWPDPVLDTVGHDPRSRYAERFWLPTLGPTALLLLRHLAAQFDVHPEGIELCVADTSRALGVGDREGSSSPIVRSLHRLESFDLACSDGNTTFAVRRNLPPANRRHLRRLPPAMQVEHAAWTEARLADEPMADARRRARRVALALLEQSDDVTRTSPDEVEHLLAATGFHPAVCHDAARWAWSRHLDAARAAGLQPA